VIPIIEHPKEERINFLSLKRQIEREERKYFNKLNFKEKLDFSFSLEKLNILYNSFRIDPATKLISYKFEIQCKRFDDQLAEKMFEKYKDIVIAEQLSEEQLIRKRKMQKELQILFNESHRKTIHNILLYNRYFFPIMSKRYWFKLFLNEFDMGYIGVPNDNTPLIKLKGTFVISINDFMKDLFRHRFMKFDNSFVNQPTTYKVEHLKMNFKLPKLFFMFAQVRIKDLIATLISEDFKTKGSTQFDNFWQFILIQRAPDFKELQEVKWLDDRTIEINYMSSHLEKAMKGSKKAFAAFGLAVGVDKLKKIKK